MELKYLNKLLSKVYTKVLHGIMLMGMMAMIELDSTFFKKGIIVRKPKSIKRLLKKYPVTIVI